MSPAIQRILIVLSASILFGIYPAASRGAYADGANGVFIILLTTFMRAAALSGFCLFKGHRLFVNKAEVKVAVRSGFFQALSVIGILGSMVYLPGPIAITILFTSTLMLLFFLWVRGEIQIDKWLIITTMLCMVGVSFVVGFWNESVPYEYIGYLFALMGAVATTSRMYIYGKLMERKHPAVVGAETFLFSCLFVSLLIFYKMPILPTTMAGYGWSLLSGLSLSLGSFALFYAVAQIGSFKFSLYNKLEPVFGAIFSALLIGEVLSLVQYVGMVVVIVSLVTYQVWEHRQKSKMPSVVEEG